MIFPAMQQKDRVQKSYDGIFRALAGLVEIFLNNFALTIRGGFC